MRESLDLYSLEHSLAWFSDTMADKPLLEHHFPSLLVGVNPITKHSSLPLLEIPSDVIIKMTRHASEMRDIIFTLLDSLSEDQRLVVGLDSEWNVNLEARRRGLEDQQRTAVLQLAHGRNIWIFQVCISPNLR